MNFYKFSNENGRMCYLISAFQLLLLNDTFVSVIKNNNCSDPIISETRDIINSRIIFSDQNTQCHEEMSLKKLKYQLSLKNSFFRSNEQQDTQECFLLL